MHTPLKPHACEVGTRNCCHLIMMVPSLSQICNKSFKRPQDLKKHEKIHTEEHHAQHKHSKAITVVDPEYISRVRGDSAPRAPESKGPLPKSLSTGPAVPVARSKSHSSSTSDGKPPCTMHHSSVTYMY